MRKSKFGAAVLAAFAVMAVSASGAQAINWTAAKYPADVLGTQTSPSATSFGFENSTTAKCETVLLAGTLGAASSSLNLDLAYDDCTAFGFADALIVPNGCTFTLKPTSGSVDTFSGTVDIKCPEGKKIDVIGGTCEVKIGPQGALGTVSYKNNTAATPDEVEATFSITALHYDKTADGPACTLNGKGTKSNGSLSGPIRLGAGYEPTLEAIDLKIQ